MQSEILNHPVDNAVFRGRIGSKFLFQTAEEGQQLTRDDIDDRNVLLAESIQTLALDHAIVGPDQFDRDALANNDLQEAQFFPVQFPEQSAS